MNTTDAVKERRLKCYHVDETTMLRLVNGYEETPQFIRFPKFKLPHNAIVLSVHNDYLLGSFCFIVASQEFEPVPEGIEPPRVGVKWTIAELKKKELQSDEAAVQTET